MCGWWLMLCRLKPVSQGKWVYRFTIYFVWVKNLYSEPDLCCNTKLNCQQRTWNFSFDYRESETKRNNHSWNYSINFNVLREARQAETKKKRMDSNCRVQWRSKDKCIRCVFVVQFLVVLFFPFCCFNAPLCFI